MQNAGTHSFSIGVTEVINTNLLIELSADDVEYVYQRLVFSGYSIWLILEGFCIYQKAWTSTPYNEYAWLACTWNNCFMYGLFIFKDFIISLSTLTNFIFKNLFVKLRWTWKTKMPLLLFLLLLAKVLTDMLKTV